MNDLLSDTPILHINTARTWRGGEKQTLYLAGCLFRKGCKSYVICQKGSELHRELEALGIPCFPLRMGSELDLIAAFRISRIAKRVNAKILHMHTAHAHALGAMSNIFYKIPGNVVSRRTAFRVRENVFSIIKYRFPDLYIAVSNGIRKTLIDCGIPGEKVVTVYSGSEIKDIENLQTEYLYDEFGVDDGTVKLVNAASLTEEKDHKTLIRAMEIIIRHCDRIKLFIAGEGKLKKELILLRDSLGLTEKVIFTGFRNDILNIIKFSDIFVISSRWEGLGTSIIDAMLLNKPVVATRTGGIPELIDDGKNGFLVERGVPGAMADAVIKLLNRKLRKSFSTLAAEKASGFSVGNMVERTLDVYAGLVRNFEL